MNIYPSQTQYGKNEDFNLEIERGLIPGHSVVNIFGLNINFVGNLTRTIWPLADTYAYPVISTKMNLSSSVNTGGDLSAKVTVNGLDQQYNPISETLTLNGTTPVVTANSYFRINGVNIASGTVTGAVSLKDLSNTTTYGYIHTTTGRSQTAVYTVPAGYSFYLTRVNAYTSLNGSTPEYAVYANMTTSSNGVVNIIQNAAFTNAYETRRVVPRRYNEKTDIQIIGRGSTPTTTQYLSVIFEGYLIKNFE